MRVDHVCSFRPRNVPQLLTYNNEELALLIVLRLELFFLRPEIRRDEFEVMGLLLSLFMAFTLDPLLPKGDKEGSFESLSILLGLFNPDT